MQAENTVSGLIGGGIIPIPLAFIPLTLLALLLAAAAVPSRRCWPARKI